MKQREWKETEGDDWEINWAEKDWIYSEMDQSHITSNQKVNHYRNFYEVSTNMLFLDQVNKKGLNVQKSDEV